jgi:hypothetical protein
VSGGSSGYGLNQVATSVEEFINLLPLDRDYGERSYDDVVRGLRDGSLKATTGHRLPQLFDSKTNMKIKGTGTPIMEGASPHQRIAAEFRSLAVDDLEMVYGKIVEGIKKGNDPRWAKLFLEFTIGRVEAARGSDGAADVISRLLDMIDSRPQTRSIEYIDG